MILSGKQIQAHLGEDIIISPFNEKQLNPNSYNLRLHNELMVYDAPILDMKKKNPTKTIVIPEEGLVLEPGKLYLGRSLEHTETKKHVPLLEGRSSIGRLGLFVHAAGFGDVGFTGYWTLHLSCTQPVRVYPRIEICQIFYHTLEGDFTVYSGSYQNNTGITPSQLYKELESD
ncbi:dCTP deaminase [archaeon]|nr:dCTP deaminase [archaeon]